jgi:small neutral amino acid transporter SnatA (MarC family)
MTPTTGFVEQQEEEKRRAATVRQARRDTWTALWIALAILLIALYLLGVSAATMAIIAGIIIVTAALLDLVERRRS